MYKCLTCSLKNDKPVNVIILDILLWLIKIDDKDFFFFFWRRWLNTIVHGYQKGKICHIDTSIERRLGLGVGRLAVG